PADREACGADGSRTVLGKRPFFRARRQPSGYFFRLVFQVPVSTTLPLYNVSKLPENVWPVFVPVIREEALWPLAAKSYAASMELPFPTSEVMGDFVGCPSSTAITSPVQLPPGPGVKV